MDNETQGIPVEKLARTTEIPVHYEGLRPEDSLLQIDGKELRSALEALGYPPSVMKPVTISNGNVPYEFAQYDYFQNSVVLRQGTIIDEVKSFYKGILIDLGQLPRDTKTQTAIQKLLESPIVQFIFPPYWPHLLKQQKETPLFLVGNKKRRNEYLKAAREGKLDPHLSLEGQRLRAQRVMERLVQYGLERFTAMTLSEEFEHIRGSTKKVALNFAMMSGAFIGGFALLDALTKTMEHANIDPQVISSASILGLLGIGGAGLLAFAKGRAMDEDKTSEAIMNNFTRYLDSFSINDRVFAREVLGRQEK